jgi:hypothetical protein
MAKKLRLSLCGVLLSVLALAQPGSYFLSHFSPDQGRFNNTCYDIVQDSRGLFYFATARGVLRFDGRNWDQIKTSGAAYALKLINDNLLYVAGSKGFGKITLNNNGLETYQPIYEEPEAAFSFQLTGNADRLYFLNDRHVFRYAGDSVTRQASDETGWIALNELFGTVLVSSEEDRTHVLENLRSTSTLFKEESTALLFAHRYGDTYLLGTTDSRIYLCGKNLKPREIVLADAAYAGASVIVNATWVTADLVALGTLRGGVLFINPKTGTTEQIINYSTGLPDNEIYSITSDKNQNIWVAHAYGFTRIAPFLPFRSFRYYQGLQGNLLCAKNFRGKVYVGTSLGLYALEREDFYDELVYYVDVPVNQATAQHSKKPDANTPPNELKQGQKEKGGIFGFLRRKKTQPATTQLKQPATTPKVVYKKEKRTRRILRSSHYVYKRINGIDSKVTDLIVWKDRLIASGLSGAFEVRGTSVSSIIDDPIRCLFASDNFSSLLLSTYDDKLHRIGLIKNEWKEEGMLTGIDNPVGYIFEEPGVAVWLCGIEKVYRLPVARQDEVQAIEIKAPDYERIVGMVSNGTVVFGTASGFYQFNPETQQLIKADSLDRPLAFFAGPGTMWIRDEHNWYALGKTDQQKIRLLNLLPDIRFITRDEPGENLWIITGSNELVYFNTGRILPVETSYPLLVRWIEQNNSTVTRASFLKLEQDNNSVRVEVVKPDYLSGHAVEYRYRLLGLNEAWSDWSASNSRIDFPYLPSGDYSLAVQSKDIFGRITDMEPVRIRVLPPYWKRPWFYAMEFAVFTLLVFASFQLSNRYRFVSRVLSLLSIIILIEFIQTVAGSTLDTEGGPVVDFVIQVGIAFVILPIEGFLRRFMLRSIEKRMGG